MSDSMVARSGGFRSRERVQWARAVWSLARVVPSQLRFDLPDALRRSRSWQSRGDRQRACPHLPHMHWSDTPGWVQCDERQGGCGLCLKNPAGWRVECERTPDDGHSWERSYAKSGWHARPGWEQRYTSAGLEHHGS